MREAIERLTWWFFIKRKLKNRDVSFFLKAGWVFALPQFCADLPLSWSLCFPDRFMDCSVMRNVGSHGVSHLLICREKLLKWTPTCHTQDCIFMHFFGTFKYAGFCLAWRILREKSFPPLPLFASEGAVLTFLNSLRCAWLHKATM